MAETRIAEKENSQIYRRSSRRWLKYPRERKIWQIWKEKGKSDKYVEWSLEQRVTPSKEKENLKNMSRQQQERLLTPSPAAVRRNVGAGGSTMVGYGYYWLPFYIQYWWAHWLPFYLPLCSLHFACTLYFTGAITLPLCPTVWYSVEAHAMVSPTCPLLHHTLLALQHCSAKISCCHTYLLRNIWSFLKSLVMQWAIYFPENPFKNHGTEDCLKSILNPNKAGSQLNATQQWVAAAAALESKYC